MHQKTMNFVPKKYSATQSTTQSQKNNLHPNEHTLIHNPTQNDSLDYLKEAPFVCYDTKNISQRRTQL